MKHKVNFKNILLIFILSLAFAGCSVGMIYSQLDWLIPWYVSDYISLDYSQQAEMEKSMNAALYWHRSTQLTEYSRLLQKTRNELEKNISEEQIDEIFRNFEDAWRTIMIKVAPDIVDILLSATEEQKLELYENIEKKDDEFYKEFIDISDAKQTRKRIKRIKKNIERWLGPLTEEQETLLVSYVHKSVPSLYDRFEFRNTWQREFRRLLEQETKTPEMKIKLEQLFTDPRNLYSEQFREKEDENMRLVKQMILDFGELMTPDQYKHLLKQLDKYALMFEEMSVQNSDVQPGRS